MGFYILEKIELLPSIFIEKSLKQLLYRIVNFD